MYIQMCYYFIHASFGTAAVVVVVVVVFVIGCLLNNDLAIRASQLRRWCMLTMTVLTLNE